MKNKTICESWERFVQRTNKLPEPWKAASSCRICGDHFQLSDYILPPSSEGTCRLKKYAIPSTSISANTTSSDELHSMVYSNKRPFPSLDPENLPPAAKIRRTATTDQREELKSKLVQKIRNLQQQLRRTKQKVKTFAEVIEKLKEAKIVNSKESEALHSNFENIHLHFLNNLKDNLKASPSGRRYTDEIKEFAVTLHYYSPSAYKYVRSIVPLPHPSLVRKWSSSFKCEPGFIDEAFTSLSDKITSSPNDKDCCLVIDAMSIRKQSLWNPEKDQYSGFIDFGDAIPNRGSEKLSTEAIVFLLVGSRSHWKCPVGYFLVDKITAKDQAKLILKSLEKAANAGLKVWLVTADGTAVNLKTFELLGCKFAGTYDEFKTSFTHPSTGEEVFAICDPCHMLKLARNALAHLGSFIDSEGSRVHWHHIEELQKLQQQEGLNLANKLSQNHLRFENHKMNVRLAAQTLSSSVANAIEFLGKSAKLPNFSDSHGTVKFIRTIDHLFDILNSRNPLGKGFKAPLRLKSKDSWEEILLSAAKYLLSLKTNTQTPQLLSNSLRKTFIIGFVTCIKTTIAMTTQMLYLPSNPFKYVMTYKFSQDHIELLFSCIRSRGGWNNNPNCLQLKYALRNMLMRNAITASRNANCVDFTGCNNIIPIFHTQKHRKPDDQEAKQASAIQPNSTDKINFICNHLNEERHSEFVLNVLFYIAGYIVSKTIEKLQCPQCKKSLLPLPTQTPANGHDYTPNIYHDTGTASSFTTFVNKGGLQIPSTSVFRTVEYCEHVFKAAVCKDGKCISSEGNLKKKMILNVCHHFALDTTIDLFPDHEDGANEILVEDDHKTKLVKCIADKYFTLRLFNYGKKYTKEIANEGKQSDRQRLNKLILFRGQ